MSESIPATTVLEVELGDHVPERIVVVDEGVTLTFPISDATRDQLRGKALRLVLQVVEPS